MSAEQKHTPGPWKLDGDPAFHRNRVWSKDMRPIVTLCSMGMAPADCDQEAQANARLIAAAPDLLAAGRLLLEAADEGDSDKAMDGYDALRAAIAKAEGRSNMAERKIITHNVCPPIPIRSMDWSAYFDGDEPNDDGQMMMGYGATEQEAIDDLKSQAEAMS